MDNHFEPLANGEVLSVAESSLILIGHRTFRVGELAEAIRTQLEYGIAGWSEDKNSWFSDEGIPCEVLRFTAQGWQKGKVRINLEFCPQEGVEVGEQPAKPSSSEQATTVTSGENEEQLDFELDSSDNEQLELAETLTSGDDEWELETASAVTVASEKPSAEFEPETSTIFSEEPSLDDMSTLGEQLEIADVGEGIAQGLEPLEEPLGGSEDLDLGDMSFENSDDLDLGDMSFENSDDLDLGDTSTDSGDDLDLGDMSFENSDDLDLGDISTDSGDDLDLGDMSFENSDDLDLGDISTDSGDDLDLGDMSELEEEEFQFGDISTDDPFEENEDTDPLLNDVWQDLNEANQHNNQ